MASVENKARDPFGMASGKGNGNRSAARNAEKRKTVETEGVNHCFEVAHERLERNLRHIPVRKAATALVIADETELRRQAGQQRRPDRALPIVLDVVEPVAHLDHRHTVSGGCDSKIHPIRRSKETYILRRCVTSFG